jgi:O-glycosyl hydrolase
MRSFLSKSRMSFLSAVLSLLVAISTCAETIRVTATAKQTFGGFGASQAWPGMVAFGPANTAIETQIYDAMFSSLKLSYIRLAVPPDYQPTAGGAYNIQAAVNAGHKNLIDAAKARTGNSIKVFYSVWSPPGWMKANGKTTGGRDRNNYLLYNMRDTFGRYLGNFVSDFQTAFGYPVNYLSMQNEPDINVSYDS